MYAIALATIAVLILAIQIIIQNHVGHLAIELEASKKIQQLRNDATGLLSALDFAPETNEGHDFLNSQIDKEFFKIKNQFDLIAEAIDQEKSTLNQNPIVSEFKEIIPLFNEFERHILNFRNKAFSATNIHEQRKIRELATEIISRLSKIDQNYSHKINSGLDQLKIIEVSSIIFVLITIILEILFIFNPVAKKIKKVIRSVVESESRAQRMAKELSELNISLKKSDKDIHDINTALEKGTILIKTDREGIITYANDRYCKITKYTKEELIGRPLFFNNQGGDESIIYEHVRDPENCTKIWQGEIYDHAKDGSSFWVDVTLYPIISFEKELYQYLVICSDITKRKKAEKQLQLIQQQKFDEQMNEQKGRSYSVILGQEQERKRMAREIHDGVGQMLTALKFGCEALNPEDDKQLEQVKGIRKLLQNIIREIRRISSDLLPTVLNDFGIDAALRDLQSIFNSSSEDIKMSFECNLDLEEPLSKTIEVSLYRITQEAVNNAQKYSKGTHIHVLLNNDAEFINLSIKDNGIGFDPEEAIKRNINKATGNGLTSMRERAELVEGTFTIESALNQGTLIYVEVPLESKNYE